MPDGVDTYRWRGQDLVVTASEGDSREWGSFADAAHVKDLTLCAAEFPHAKALQKNEALGRLNVLTDLGYDAARGEAAEPLYERFMAELEAEGVRVERGVFGAEMDVALTNAGPFTLIVDSDDLAAPRRA